MLQQLTTEGALLGTVAYMSPEQVRAKELDARTDLFSYGAVLYEMATGKPPFEGASAGEICGAILHQEPVPPSQINMQLSPVLEAVILKALEKDRSLRYQHAADVRADLQRVKRDSESGRAIAAQQLSVGKTAQGPPSGYPQMDHSGDCLRGPGRSRRWHLQIPLPFSSAREWPRAALRRGV